MKVSASKAAITAARWTKQAANIKDWRLNARDRKLRDLAIKLTVGGAEHGFIFASVPELAKKYPWAVPDEWLRSEAVYIWGVHAGVPGRNGHIELSLAPVTGWNVGDRIHITRLDDPYSKSYVGREGVIEHIDSMGQLHGTWGGLAVIPEVDDFEII